MLLESLLESTPVQRQRRRWATLLSFLLQLLAVTGLVILPLLYTEALPHLREVVGVPAPPPPPGRAGPPELPRHSRVAARNDAAPIGFHVPGRIPRGIHNPPQQEIAAAPSSGSIIENSIGDGDPRGVWNSLFARAASPPPPPPPTRRAPLPVSGGVIEGLRIRGVAPVYPRLAIAARVEGDVLLSAVISREGVIENLQVLRGHPLLVAAAIEAVRQWRYRPYYLNGDPVEVSTQITVRFVLQH